MTDGRCPMPHQRLVYSYEEAAEQLSISLRVLKQLLAAGHIASIGYRDEGRRRGITHQSLVDFIREREAEELVRSA